MRDQAAAALHLGDDQIRHPAPVEAVRAAVPDRLERRGQVGLAQHACRRPGGAPSGRKLARDAGKPRQPRAVSRDRAAPVLVHHEAVARQADGGRDHGRERQPPEPAMRLRQPGHGARHARGEVAGDAPLGRLAGASRYMSRVARAGAVSR